MKRNTPTPSRRQFLVLGGGAVAGAAALGACSSTPAVQSSGTVASTASPPTAPTTTESTDTATLTLSALRTATSLEASIVAFYDKMLAATYLPDAAKTWARTIQANHKVHVTTLQDLTTKVGGKAYPGTNRQVDRVMIAPKLAQANATGSSTALVTLAGSLEETAASTLTLSVGSIGLPSTRQTVMTVGAADARYVSVWNLFGSGGDLTVAVPAAMQSLRDALPPSALIK